MKNVAIGAAFQYMYIVEKWGSGIPRIFKESQSYGLRTPEIIDFGTSLRVNIYRRPFEFDEFGVINPAIRGIHFDDSDKNPAFYQKESGGLDKNQEWKFVEQKCKEKKLNVSTIKKIERIFLSISGGQEFSASTVRKLVGCADSTARSLIQKLKEIEVLTPVFGKGKGVYRFKL